MKEYFKDKECMKGLAMLVWFIGVPLILLFLFISRVLPSAQCFCAGFLVWCLGVFIMALIKFIKNQISPERSLPGRIVRHFCSIDDDGSSYNTVFLLEDGTRVYSSSRELYNSFNVCDYGIVSFKGTRFTGFNYVGGVSMTDIQAFIIKKQRAGKLYNPEYLITFESEALDSDDHQITFECSKADYDTFHTGDDGLLSFNRGIFKSFITKKY